VANYALSCFYCNLSKQAFVTGIDPKTKAEEQLFHPRKDRWEKHFRWKAGYTEIEAITAKGRATLSRLNMNRKERKEARALWVRTEIWP